MEVSSYDDQDQILRYMDECSKVLFLELSLSTCIDNNCKISIFIPLNKKLLKCVKTWDMIFIWS